MATVNLGRIRGAGFFYSSATSGTSVSTSSITPTNISPLIGDHIMFSNGDIRQVTALGPSSMTCGSVLANFKGSSGSASSDSENIKVTFASTLPAAATSFSVDLKSLNLSEYPLVSFEYLFINIPSMSGYTVYVSKDQIFAALAGSISTELINTSPFSLSIASASGSAYYTNGITLYFTASSNFHMDYQVGLIGRAQKSFTEHSPISGIAY